MKTSKYIIGTLCAAALATAASCSLQYDPVDTYSDVTEGVKEDGKEAVFKDKAADLGIGKFELHLIQHV